MLNPGEARPAEAAKITQSQIVTSAASKPRSHRHQVLALASLEGRRQRLVSYQRRSTTTRDLILRRREAPSRRMAANSVLVAILRDAGLRPAPQDEGSTSIAVGFRSRSPRYSLSAPAGRR